jgi:C-terminal processing protease CtpA/Prc
VPLLVNNPLRASFELASAALRCLLLVAAGACTGAPHAVASSRARSQAASVHHENRNEAAQSHGSDESDFLTIEQREDELRFLVNVIEDSYAHLELKEAALGVSLAEVFERYLPLVRRASDYSDYERAMVGFVAEFRDAHLTWRRKRGPTEARRRFVRLGLETTFVDQRLIVSEVWPGSAAARAGLRRGDWIVAIDGESIDDRVERLWRLRSFSRAEVARRHFTNTWMVQRIPAARAPKPRLVTRRALDGRATETIAIAPELEWESAPDRPPIELGAIDALAYKLDVRTLDEGIATIRSLARSTMRSLHREPRPVIVDLRGNSGGFDNAAREVAAMFSRDTVTGAVFRVRLSPLTLDERPDWRDLAGDPGRPSWSLPQPFEAEGRASEDYPAPIFVLLDESCSSSCETLALLLRAQGARLLGRRTAGSSGGPIRVELPHSGAEVSIPVWAMYDLEGRPIEGRGIAPDEVIEPSLTDVLARRDPVLLRAIELARTGSEARQAPQEPARAAPGTP